MGNHWWFNIFIIPYLIFVPVVYSIFDSIIARFNKGGKVDYAKEMVADYEPLEMSEDGFTPKHNH